MRALNLNSYRFSLAWPRIQPTAQAGPTERLDFYSRLVDASAGSEDPAYADALPLGPAAATRRRGRLDETRSAERFADYAEIMARALGDRVEYWSLLNEPAAFLSAGYLDGTHAPGRHSVLDFLRGTHVANLAQGAGFRALKAVRPQARVGSVFSMSPCEPATDSDDDRVAAERAHAITNVWFLEPALRGRYPSAFWFSPAVFMKIHQDDMDRVRAPLISSASIFTTARWLRRRRSSERLTDLRFLLLPARMTVGQTGPKTILAGKSGHARCTTW